MQWIALYYLGKHNNINQRDLAKLMNIKESTIARLIDRMEREKLVIRKKNQSDKRVINIILTQKGKETRVHLLPEGEKFNELISTGIKEDELEIFMNVLHKIVSNASKHNIK